MAEKGAKEKKERRKVPHLLKSDKQAIFELVGDHVGSLRNALDNDRASMSVDQLTDAVTGIKKYERIYNILNEQLNPA